jgi:hypothetical protein
MGEKTFTVLDLKMTNSLVSDVVYSKAKIKVSFKGNTLKDALDFGFSYFESEDHIVEFVVANARVIKKMFGEIADSALKPEGDTLGELWTAKLLLSDRLSDSEIFFSNNTFSMVIDLNLDPDYEE